MHGFEQSWKRFDPLVKNLADPVFGIGLCVNPENFNEIAVGGKHGKWSQIKSVRLIYYCECGSVSGVLNDLSHMHAICVNVANHLRPYIFENHVYIPPPESHTTSALRCT